MEIKYFAIVPYFCLQSCGNGIIFRVRGAWWKKAKGMQCCQQMNIDMSSYRIFNADDLVAVERWNISYLQSHNIIDSFLVK